MARTSSMGPQTSHWMKRTVPSPPLFEVTKYDAKFWTIKAVGLNAYVYTDSNDGNKLKMNRGLLLSGDNLFELTPPNVMG